MIPVPIPPSLVSQGSQALIDAGTVLTVGLVVANQGTTATDADGKAIGLGTGITYDVAFSFGDTLITVSTIKPSQGRPNYMVIPQPPNTPCPVYVTAGYVYFQVFETPATSLCT